MLHRVHIIIQKVSSEVKPIIRFLGKKASHRMLVVLVMFLIAVPVMIIFFSATSHQVRHTHFLYSFYAADLPLIAEALQAVPGDVQINYPLEDDFVVTLGRD